MKRVVVRSTRTGNEVWSHELTGQPLINYVPALAFQMEENREVNICIEGEDE